MNSLEHEEKRIEALNSVRLLDSDTEGAFDRLTQFASQALAVPISLISLVSNDRQFFKSQCGLAEGGTRPTGTALTHSFCKHVVWNCTPLVVEDARADPMLAGNPAVKEVPVIAYAGVPIVDGKGYCLGSLCVVDRKPRRWRPNEIDLLNGLAKQTATEIELRAQNRKIGEELDAIQRTVAERQAMNRLTVHDLRTPLGALMMTLDIIGMFGPLTDQQRELLNLAIRSSNVLKSLVDDLLDFEAVGMDGSASLKRERCDPYALADLAVEQVSPLSRDKGIAITKDYVRDVTFFSGDASKLSRMLVNLLANAIKFTPRGGSITVRLSPVESPPGVAFQVVDTGIGFAPEHAEAIFREGYRVDSKRTTRESTGFGLAFCKRIVEAHGGQIQVTSEEGKGSSFHVTLPG